MKKKIINRKLPPAKPAKKIVATPVKKATATDRVIAKAKPATARATREVAVTAKSIVETAPKFPTVEAVKAVTAVNTLSLSTLEGEGSKLLDLVKHIKITLPEHEHRVTHSLSMGKAIVKKIEAFWIKIIDPIEIVLDGYKEQRKDSLMDLKEVEVVGKQKINAWLEEQDAAAKAAAEAENENRRQRRITELRELTLKYAKEQNWDAIAKLNGQTTEVVEDIPEQTQVSEGGQRRYISKLVIFDAAKIPDEYWVIDEVKLKAALLGSKTKGIAPKKVPGAGLKRVPNLAINAANID